MKLVVTFKTPDAVESALASSGDVHGDEMSDNRWESLVEHTNEQLKPWIEYGEYVRIEFDTKAKTAKVLKNK